MKRQALSAVNTNLSRAEQLAQWKEAKAHAADAKKRPRTTETTSDDWMKKLRTMKDSIREKDAKIEELRNEIETQTNTINAMTDKVSRLEDIRFKMEADSEALHLNIQQLKSSLRKSVLEHEDSQEAIRALKQKCDVVPALQSHIAELALLNKCLRESPSLQPALESSPKTPKVTFPDKKLADVFESEKMALQAEIKALKSSNESLQHRCEELQFTKQLLLQQNAELLENAMKYVAKKNEENRSEREAERNELTSAMSSMEAELTESLDKSLKKIVELQQEIAELRQQQELTNRNKH